MLTDHCAFVSFVCPQEELEQDIDFHCSRDSSGVNVGGFDWNLQFNWHGVPERERSRHSHTAEAVATPTMAGGLFSIDRKFFERLGTYDSGFDIWGGENLELSFKVIYIYFLNGDNSCNQFVSLREK